MATLLPTITEQDTFTSQNTDLEPDIEWKNTTIKQIEALLRPAVDEAKAQRDRGLGMYPLDDATREKICKEYDRTIEGIKRLAQEQLMHALEQERQTRRWAAGGPLDVGWNEALAREQQGILDGIKRKGSVQQQDLSVVQNSVDDQNRDTTDGPSRVGERDSSEESLNPRHDTQPSDSENEENSVASGGDRDIPAQKLPEALPIDSYGYGSHAEPVSYLHRGFESSSSRMVGLDTARGDHDIPAQWLRDAAISSYGYTKPDSYLDRDSEASSSRTVGFDTTRPSVTRQRSTSSLSKRPEQEFWRPSSPPDTQPTTSRTLAHATAAMESPISPVRRDSITGDTSRSVSRSGSLRARGKPQQDGEFHVSSHASREIPGSLASESLLSRTREKQREPQSPQQIRPRKSTDFRWQTSVPPSPAGSAQFPPADGYSYQPNSVTYREAEEPPGGIPIRGASSSRQPLSPQGSPDTPRHQLSSFNGGRSIANKSSFTREADFRHPQASPNSRWVPSPQGASVPSNRPIVKQQSFTIDSSASQQPSSPSHRGWYGPQIPPGSVRRNSSGAHSLRSQSSRQDFYGPIPRRLATYDEQSVASGEYGSDSDSDIWNPDLELAERREEDEAEKRAMEAKAMAEAARRREAEVKQREAELKQKEEEARRKQAEAKQKQEEVKRKEAEAKRREAEAKRKEEEEKRLEAEAKWKVAEAKRKEEEARRVAEEARRKEEEARRIAEEERRKEEEAKRMAEEARRKEEERKRKEAENRLKEAEARRRDDEIRRKEQESRRKEQEVNMKEEETRRKEEDIKRREEELHRREEDLVRREQEAILKGQDEDFLKQQEEMFRRAAEERKRQDSMSSTSDSSRPTAGRSHASVPPSNPWPIPKSSSSSSSSSSTDRSSTASSSSWTSSASGWSSSGRSNSSAYTQTSTSSYAPSTPTATSSHTASTPSPSMKPPPQGRSTGGSTPTQASASSKPTTAFPSTGPSSDEEEWRRRQEERARKQQEQFKHMQEQMEWDKQAKSSKPMSRDDVVRLFEEHERRWADLPNMDVLSWSTLPWPMLRRPEEPDDLTTIAISAYVLSPHYPGEKAKSPRDRIKEHIRRWHPDRFETKLLPKVRKDDQDKVKQGAGLVARNLNEILTRQSSANDLFS
ncbi:hypothetical protein SCP_1103080 [Sparassis crispa]|uniref:J domain-containing protein n=1 Tax=Sparassis crispa TaxID=139825 RepID=A0A401GZN9_9APHY|nr:hypothetical protein SCP_1103080 [Sparassis crispa]GBE87631.1 hypothetical protein SCP_1103080 [Sparassis crispa]